MCSEDTGKITASLKPSFGSAICLSLEEICFQAELHEVGTALWNHVHVGVFVAVVVGTPLTLAPPTLFFFFVFFEKD